jgi:hypothetical protein
MGFLRSTATRVAAVGAVALSAVALAAVPASAATGTLTIKKDGAVIWSKTNPAADCYLLGKDFPQSTDVINNLDVTVWLYDNPNCAGDRDGDVLPGTTLHYSYISLRVL